eukprot:2948500-Prymnesium_polylepis.1
MNFFIETRWSRALFGPMRRSTAVTAGVLLCTCCQEALAQPGAIQTWVNKGHDNEVHTDADIDPDDF